MHTELARLLGNEAEKLYPWQLAQAHPRIVDQIVTLWPRRHEMESYFDDLLVDRRGNREGFPPVVLMEILSLKDYYLAQRKPQERSVNTWGEMTDIGGVVQKVR